MTRARPVFAPRRQIVLATLFFVAMLPVLGGSAAAEEDAHRTWKGSGQFSFLTASGNSRSKSGSVRFELVNDWPEVDRITFKAGALYNESEGDETAEAEYLNGKYDYFHTPRTYSLYFLGVERDKFAGFDYRVTGRVGIGHQVVKSERNTFDVEGGLDYVYEKQEDDTENFPAARLYGKYTHKFAERISFLQDLEVLENLKDTQDCRVNTLTSLEVGLNSYLSFKTALTVKYDHQPVPGNQTLDYFTETALVVTF
jgi:putative salt-induced outer membrane protein